jgi:hypothetical protein
MRTLKALSAVAVLAVLQACGGEPKPAHSPEPTLTSDSSQADMPAAPADKASEPATEDKPGADAQSGIIKVAAMKLVPAKKGKDDKAVELKADGTITVDGKPFAKVAGDQVDALDGGGTLVTVGIDGSLVGQAVKPGFKFDGDDLVTDTGAKLSIGDDGTLTSTKDDKAETLGKLEGGEQAKRAALIVAVLTMKTTAPAVPAAKSKK